MTMLTIYRKEILNYFDKNHEFDWRKHRYFLQQIVFKFHGNELVKFNDTIPYIKRKS